MSENEFERIIESYKLTIDREISARKSIKQKLEEKNIELNQANEALKKLAFDFQSEVEKKNKDLLAAYNEALDASKTKTQFIATISHEMRTPLNAILGFTELIKKNISRLNIGRYISNIDSAAESLLQLINDVLDLSKIETNNIDLESLPFNLYELTHKIKETYEILALQKDLRLTLYIDPKTPKFVIGDEHRINQILINIVSNAIKFTKKGQVSIYCKPQSISDQYVKMNFVVNDTGIGIPEEQLPYIFESFQQADGSITRRYGGTGLGLSISRQLVKLMGGNLSVRSHLNYGSCFSFCIPLLINQVDTDTFDQTDVTDLKTLRGKHALLVEDNPLNTELIVDLLTSSHLTVSTAKNGLEALKWYHAGNRCDFILMDMQMPVMDGIEATKNFKSLHNFNIPIVALTANATQSSLTECIEAGMDAFITKPICFNKLSNALTKLLNQSNTSPLTFIPEKKAPNTLELSETLERIHPKIKQDFININHALGLLAGNLKTYKKIVKQFIIGYEEGIYSLNNLIESKDHESIVRLFHTMKSVADNLGAIPLANFCKKIDGAISINNIDPAKLAALEYQALLNESAQALTNWIASNK